MTPTPAPAITPTPWLWDAPPPHSAPQPWPARTHLYAHEPPTRAMHAHELRRHRKPVRMKIKEDER